MTKKNLTTKQRNFIIRVQYIHTINEYILTGYPRRFANILNQGYYYTDTASIESDYRSEYDTDLEALNRVGQDYRKKKVEIRKLLGQYPMDQL